ncbi:MAG: LamG-like jellyroll fold domain-containing protein [Planctomycetota bacterium]
MELIRSEPILRYEFLALDGGLVRDRSGHGHDARLVGEAEIVPDERFARCLALDGERGHLAIPFSPVLQARRAFTIEAWLRSSDEDAKASIFQYPRRSDEDRKFEYGLELGRGRLRARVGGHAAGLAAHDPFLPGAWHHVAATWDGALGRVAYYVDGERVDEQPVAPAEIAYGSAHALLIGRTAAGTEPFRGRLAALRLYERELSPAEIRRDQHADERERFTFEDSHPIAFRFFDDLDENRMYVTDETSPGRAAHLVLTNLTPFDIELPATAAPVPSADDHHIELCFRPGTLAPDAIDGMSVAEAGWMSSVAEREDKLACVRLSYPHSTVLRAGRRLALTLQHVKADPFGGARSSQVELRFRGLRYAGEGFELRGHRLEHVDVVNQTGRRRPILRAGFTGSDLVMNDGETSNRLQLYLGNGSKTETVRLRPRSDPAPTRIALAFEAGEDDDTWAVGTVGQLEGVDVEPRDPAVPSAARPRAHWHLHKDTLGESPLWLLTLHEELELVPGAQVAFEISKLVTSLPSGTANLYVHYENVPGHWDGEIACPIRKAPRRFAGDAPAVGAPLPNAGLAPDGLEVLGRIKSKNLVLGEDRILARDAGEKTELFLQPEGGGVTLGSIGGPVAHPSSLEVVGAIRAHGEVRDKDGLVVPKGVIVLWSGAADQVPQGWELCDKEREVNGVQIPDLKGRFVVGLDTAHADYKTIGGQGGADRVQLKTEHMPSHSHTVTLDEEPEHRHTAVQAGGLALPLKAGLAINPFGGPAPVLPVSKQTTAAGAHTHPVTVGAAGGDTSHENRPPYFVLAYIIKV